MTIDVPGLQQIPQLRTLWQQAFGDPAPFLDSFFATGFAPERCRCIRKENRVVAALYWFDCFLGSNKIAYLYAVATDKAFQGQGLCRTLIADTHAHLQKEGYTAVVLVPGSRELFLLYEKLGYRTCCHIREFSCEAASSPVPLRQLDAEEYAALRREFLPRGGVRQEGSTLTFLQTFARFWAGENFLLAGSITEDGLQAAELLGNSDAAPGILAALGLSHGRFRTPGSDRPFAMHYPLAGTAPVPKYLGLALD